MIAPNVMNRSATLNVENHGIEDQPVTPRIEYRLDRDRRLHDPEIRRQMSAGPANMANQKLADFPAKLPLFGVCQRQKIRSGMNFL